jgi:hypothetical protein
LATRRKQSLEIIERARENDDVTPLSAMLENLAVISVQAKKLVQEGVPLHDPKHLSVQKLLQDCATGLAPYLHPRLSATVAVTAPAPAAEEERGPPALDELLARLRRLAEDNGVTIIPPVVPYRGSEPPVVRKPPTMDAIPSDQPRSKIQPGDEWKDARR